MPWYEFEISSTNWFGIHKSILTITILIGLPCHKCDHDFLSYVNAAKSQLLKNNRKNLSNTWSDFQRNLSTATSALR